MKESWHENLMHINVIFMHENDISMHENENFASKVFIDENSMNEIFGKKLSFSRMKLSFSMHRNFIFFFRHEVFMPHFCHA